VPSSCRHDARGQGRPLIGVDTHRDGHSAAILDPTGGLIAQIKVPSSEANYATLLSFVAERTLGRRCWALGGTGCYSAGLTSFPPNYGEW
jgi:transposase